MTGETIGLAVVVWIASFAVIAIFKALGIYDNLIFQFFAAVIIGGLVYKLASKKIVHDFRTTAIWLGIIWCGFTFALHMGPTRIYFPDIFTSFGLWASLFLILVTPYVHYVIDKDKF